VVKAAAHMETQDSLKVMKMSSANSRICGENEGKNMNKSFCVEL